MINQWPCIYAYALTLEKHMEMVYRWSHVFKGSSLCQLILQEFFSKKTIENSNPSVICATCKFFNRVATKNMADLSNTVSAANESERYIFAIIENCLSATDKILA